MRIGRLGDLRKDEARDEIGRFTSGSGGGYSLRRNANGGTDVHSDADGRLGSLHERYAGASLTTHHGLYVSGTGPPTPVPGPRRVSSDEPEHTNAQIATAQKMAAHHEKRLRDRARAQKDQTKMRTIGDLQKAETSETALDHDEVALLQMLRDCEAKHRDLLQQMQTLQSRMIANLTPQARAAADAMGMGLKRDLGRIEETSMQVQKRLIGCRMKQVRTTLAKRGTAAIEAEIATLRGYVRAIETGKVSGNVTTALRREVVRSLMAAEIELEAMR